MLKMLKALKAKSTLTARLRLFIGLCMLGAVVVFVDLKLIFAQLSAVTWSTALFMICVQMLIIVMLSWRFSIIAHALGADIPAVDSYRLTFGATFANMLLPTALAGDAGRIWLVQKFGLTRRAAIGVGVFDRLLGLAALGGVVCLGSFLDQTIVPLWGGVAFAVVFALITMIMILRLKTSASLENTGVASTSRESTGRPQQALHARVFFSVTALSFAGHIASVIVVFAFLQDQGQPVSFGQTLVLFPAVLFVAAIPISVGGWGTRELAAVAVFTTIGLAAPVAIAMAFMHGVTQVLAAGLGTAFYAVRGGRFGTNK